MKEAISFCAELQEWGDRDCIPNPNARFFFPVRVCNKALILFTYFVKYKKVSWIKFLMNGNEQ